MSHQRPGAMDDQPRLRRTRSVGRHAGHGRRRDLRQRAFRRPVDRRARERRPCGLARRGDHGGPGRGDGVRLRSQPPAADRRGAAVGDFRVGPGEPAALRRPRARRWRSASGRSRSTRPAPAACFRIPIPAGTRAGRDAVVGRRAGRSRGPEGHGRLAARGSRPRTATSSSTTAPRPPPTSAG